MRVKIIRKTFSGVEFCPEMRALHLGGQSSANVERLYFELPEEWQGKSVTLHIQQQDGTLPAPILLDEEHSVAVGKAFTAAKCGSWMLLALGEDGYRALTRPTKYDCYETLATDGDAEISPTQYETFVARVLAYANSAQSSAQEARNSAASAKKDAAIAQMAQNTAQAAAAQAETAQGAAESGAKRAEDAAARAELTAPADGAVRSVNGKGGVVLLTAADVGAVDENSAGYVKRIEISGRTVTVTMGDGSTQTLQTKDTTALGNMTGILSAEHGGTGKNGALTAEDVGAAEKTTTETELADRYRKTEVDQKFTDLRTEVDEKLAGLNVNPFGIGAIYQSTDAASPAALFGGTWEQIAENRVLMGASTTHAAGSTAEAGLPNITGSMVEGSKDQGPFRTEGYLVCEGAFSGVEKSNSFTGHARVTGKNYDLYFDASASNAVYGASDTVQPPAYYVYIWRRVA